MLIDEAMEYGEDPNMMILLNRIRKLAPQMALKIWAFLIIQDPSEEELIMLADAPDKVIEEMVEEAKESIMSHRPVTPRPYSILYRKYRASSSDSIAHSSNSSSNSFMDAFSYGFLVNIEVNIHVLLKPIAGFPISVAVLQKMYEDKYGRILEPEGRAIFSLPFLLARLKSIRLIERPYGQLFVVLDENYSHYERTDSILFAARSISLTFSAFIVKAVSNYLSSFGEIEGVQKMCQDKRISAVVTFSCPDAAKMILAKEDFHFISGECICISAVYYDKALRREYAEIAKQLMYYNHNLGTYSEDLEAPESPNVGRMQCTKFPEAANHGYEQARKPFPAPPSNINYAKFPSAERFHLYRPPWSYSRQ